MMNNISHMRTPEDVQRWLERMREREPNIDQSVEWYIRDDLSRIINTVFNTIYVKEGDVWWRRPGSDNRFKDLLLSGGRFRPATQEEILDFTYTEKMDDW